jgi:P-type Cu+ transporter
MTKDVVCGMQVDEKSAPHKSQYQGKTFAFCSAECKTKFDQQPQSYASKAAQTAQ